LVVRGVGHGEHHGVGVAGRPGVVAALDVAARVADERAQFLDTLARLGGVSRADRHHVSGARPADRQPATLTSGSSDETDAHGCLLLWMRMMPSRAGVARMSTDPRPEIACAARLELTALDGLPLVAPGDDLGALI